MSETVGTLAPAAPVELLLLLAQAVAAPKVSAPATDTVSIRFNIEPDSFRGN
jgi:hypothetical protein